MGSHPGRNRCSYSGLRRRIGEARGRNQPPREKEEESLEMEEKLRERPQLRGPLGVGGYLLGWEREYQSRRKIADTTKARQERKGTSQGSTWVARYKLFLSQRGGGFDEATL